MRYVKCVSLYCFNFWLHFRHPTSCCSIAEILSVLFFHTMRYKGKFCEQNKVKEKCDQNIETCRNIYRYGYSFFEIRQYTRWKSSLLSITIREKSETRVLKSEIHNLHQPERLNFNIKSEHTSLTPWRGWKILLRVQHSCLAKQEMLSQLFYRFESQIVVNLQSNR